jgi:Na+/phosphate symporter
MSGVQRSLAVNRSTTYAVILFAGLAVVAAALLIAASIITDAIARAILVQMGCAIFGTGLTLFLLRLLSANESRQAA